MGIPNKDDLPLGRETDQPRLPFKYPFHLLKKIIPFHLYLPVA
jgi:hypothetical protein